MNQKAMDAREKEWETEADLDALCRAAAVKKDPDRMKRCQALAKKRLSDSKSRLATAQNMVDMGEGKMP